MTDIGRRLARFLSHDDGIGIDESKGIDDDFAWDRLDWIDDNCNCSRLQLLKRLLCIDVDAG